MLSQDAVDALFQSPGASAQAVEEGGAAHEVVRYDFRHPHRISKERLRTLEAMYERLTRSLEGWLMGRVRSQVDLSLVGVEQLSFREFTLALPTPCSSFLFDVRDSGGQQGVIEIGRELAGVVVDRFFGGSGEPIVPERALTPIERMAVRLLAERIARLVAEIWSDHVALELTLNGFETIPEIIRATGGDDSVLVTTLSVEVAGVASEILLCLPLSVIDSFLLETGSRRLESTSGTREERLRSRRLAAAALGRVRVDLAVRLPQFRVPMQELMSLHEGAVLTTGIHQQSPVEVRVRDQVRFRGRPARQGEKLAITIDDAVPPDLVGRRFHTP